MKDVKSSLKVKVKVTQSCPALCNPRDYTILQARILEWIAYPFSRGSFRPRNQTGVSCTADRFFTSWAMRENFLTHEPTGAGNGKPLQYSCLENPMNSMKRQNDRILAGTRHIAYWVRIWNSSTRILSLPGASVRHSARGKGHEEGGSAYAIYFSFSFNICWLCMRAKSLQSCLTVPLYGL